MKSKTFSLLSLFLTLALLLVAGVTVWIVDPFYQYHKPMADLQPLVNRAEYQNVGMARHLDYDSVITGSSMTENFRASWFDEAFGGRTLKLPFSGGRSKDFDILFSAIFEHGGIRRVYYGLDIYALIAESDATRNEWPTYLNDESLLNDVNYLLNKDVLFGDVADALYNTQGEPGTTLDEAYVWEQHYTFSKEATLKTYHRAEVSTEKPETYYLDICRQNLKNIMPHIESHPETEFYIFFSPYSILYWDDTQRNGTTQATIAALRLAMNTLLEQENVKLFYFQNVEEIVTNLDNYKDYTHYGPNINRLMLECMKNGEHRVTKDTMEAELEQMYRLAVEFDYEALFS